MIAGKLEPMPAQYPNIDGVVPLTMAAAAAWRRRVRDGRVRRTLAGYTRHPNMAAVVILGWDARPTRISGLMDAEGLQEGPEADHGDPGRGRRQQDGDGAVGFLKELLPKPTT